MRYEEFINYVLKGHEFEGFICSYELKILNIDDDYITVIIDKEVNKYSYDEIQNVKIFNNKTFEEIYNDIELIDMY